jgi:GNAT superfamily N-acetyltransferase
MHDPGRNAAYMLGFQAEHRLAGAIIGVRRSRDAETSGGVLLFAVDPAFRRRGIGTQLLAELESRMRADGLSRMLVGGTTPNFFWPGLDIRYTPAFCLFMRDGYEIDHMPLNMSVDLHARSWDTAAIDRRLAEQGIEVRRLVPADRLAYSAWLADSWGSAWHDEGMNAFANDPISGFIAIHAGRLCAFAVYNVEGFAGHFGPTGTDDSQRGRGIATALFYRCMEDLRRGGLDSAEVVWVGPIAYYTRIADAIAHRAFWLLHKQLVPPATPAHAM